MALLAENWQVYSGVVSLAKLPEPYRVERIILSEIYDSETNDHDIALLKLAAPVDFNGQSDLPYGQISTTTQTPPLLKYSPAHFRSYDIYIDSLTSYGIKIGGGGSL